MTSPTASGLKGSTVEPEELQQPREPVCEVRGTQQGIGQWNRSAEKERITVVFIVTIIFLEPGLGAILLKYLAPRKPSTREMKFIIPGNILDH